ncbi:MAG: hypothetical protein Q7J57_09245, partial [Gemmobacter sp.]|nr:hypothetical protein [Gemmobacter sp.]
MRAFWRAFLFVGHSLAPPEEENLMRGYLTAGLLALASPLAAQDISAEIGRDGLTATEARLNDLPAPTDADLFALGGVRFLKTVEGALQTRWQYGVTQSMAIVPFLRLPLAENPVPTPFQPEVIADLFRDVAKGMD